MKEKQDFYTPAEILAELGRREVKKDYKSVDLKLSVVNLVQAVDGQDEPCFFLKRTDKR